MDVKTLSAIIGHVSAKTTLDIYLHSTDTMQRRAADKIDRGICKNTEIRDDTESVPEESRKEPPKMCIRDRPCTVSTICVAVMLLPTTAGFSLKMPTGSKIDMTRTVITDGKNILHKQVL